MRIVSRMDRAEVAVEIEDEPVLWARIPKPLRELIMRVLSGVDKDGVSAPLSVISARYDGEFAYRAGVSGTPVFPATGRVVSIAASAPAGSNATVKINNGDTITIEAGRAWSNTPEGRLMNPTIVFTGTSAYFVELVIQAQD